MTDAEAEELGRRLVACAGFRWLPGMLLRWVAPSGPSSVRLTADNQNVCLHSCWPDLRDPATLGCVLALVRERHGPTACVEVWDGHRPWTVFGSRRKQPAIADGDTEAEALVAAMEAP